MSFANRDEDKTVKDEASTEPMSNGKDAMRPIPDGGLQQSMPDWLRRPPAWRNLPQRAEPAPPISTDEVAPVAAKALPEPDTSEIDPRSLVDLADLPQWLQDVAERTDARAAVTAPATTTLEPPAQQPAETPKEPAMSNPENRNPVEIGTERSIPFEPVKKGAMDVPEHETKTYGGGAPKQGMNPVMLGIIALAAVVILALLLLAFL